MWIADNWKDYEVLDTSSGEKLERWGSYILVRPDPQVIWNTARKDRRWKEPNGHYHRSSKGGGEWEFSRLPQEWDIQYSSPRSQNLTFHLKPFSFKHTGLFPEQAVNWDWTSSIIRESLDRNPSRGIRVLNLFAYTGGATLSAAAAGAHVTHVDASKGMVGWAKENAAASGRSDGSWMTASSSWSARSGAGTHMMPLSWIRHPTGGGPKERSGRSKIPFIRLSSSRQKS